MLPSPGMSCACHGKPAQPRAVSLLRIKQLGGSGDSNRVHSGWVTALLLFLNVWVVGGGEHVHVSLDVGDGPSQGCRVGWGWRGRW